MNTQVRDYSTNNVVKYAVRLATQGTPQDCHELARTREFHDLCAKKDDAPWVRDFPYSERAELYAHVNNQVLGNTPIDYLEFGVAQGGSLKAWLGLNQHPESRFFGFDSFEGLPEHWHAKAPKGAYSTGRKIPDLDDSRVSFVQGLFQQTVDAFSREFSPRNQLVLHMDADLYTSTLYVLMNMDRHIHRGAVLLFDEFNARCFTDEFAALQDWSRACMKPYTFIARRTDFAKVAVQVL